ALEVDRDLVFFSAELAHELSRAGERARAALRAREAAAIDGVDSIERRVVAQERLGLALDGPTDARVRARRADELERGQRVDDVSDRAQPDEENAGDHAGQLLCGFPALEETILHRASNEARLSTSVGEAGFDDECVELLGARLGFSEPRIVELAE